MPRRSRTKPAIPATFKPAVVRLAYSRAEVAEALGVDLQTIDGLIASRQLRASRLGKPGSLRPRVVIRADSLKAMLDANPV